jgi:hypothetical protein
MIIRHLSIDCAYINKVLEPITQREHGVTEFEIETKNHGADIDLSECTLATYYGLKADEHKVGVECRVDKDKGLIYLPLYLQMTTAEGVLKGIVELQFPEGNVRFSGVNFKVSFAPDDTKIESTDDFNILENFISKPTTDGVVGQVLSIDNDGNTIWRTLKEFDGDYAHLNHRPSINGVELNGDKSLEDLNIKQTYTADDIPFADGETFQQKFNNGELKGQDGVSGADGKTPIKGTDYFTAEDKTEFTTEVTESLKPEFAKKQDKLTTGSVTTDNIASKSVTMEKLSDDVTNQLSKLKDDIGDRNITLDFNYDGYIDKKGKLSTLVAFKTTDFIAISSRVIVKGEFKDLNSPLYYINCYDSNKNYLGGTINAISSGNKIVNVNSVVTLIEGTCFIRVTNHPKSISMVKMWYSLSDTGDLSLVNQKIEESKTNNSIYSNIINDGLGFSVFSKFASVGDSLSVGYNTEKDGTPISEDLKHSWGAYIEKRCGTKSFWTGKSGQTCKTWLNTTSETWGLNYCKSIGTMPLYVICMGANEPGINIGTTDDIDTDNDTLYGYVSKVINELRNISPKSYIVCTGVSREQNSPSINEVYKTICELKEKCYYLDCFKEFNSEPFTSYFFNWHYSANGYSAMANLFDYKLKEVMAKNVEDFKYVNEADN